VSDLTRSDAGTIVAGSGGRPRGAKNLLSRRMLEELDEAISQHGPSANPLLCLMNIYMDAEEKSHVRVMAADRLLSRVMPKKIEITDTGRGDTVLRARQMIVQLNAALNGKEIDASPGSENAA